MNAVTVKSAAAALVKAVVTAALATLGVTLAGCGALQTPHSKTQSSAVYAFGLLPLPLLPKLLLQVILGAAVYLLAGLFLKNESLQTLLAALRRTLRGAAG